MAGIAGKVVSAAAAAAGIGQGRLLLQSPKSPKGRATVSPNASNRLQLDTLYAR